MTSKFFFQNGLFIVFFTFSSLKTMQVELFLDESCLNSCELLMIKRKTNFASYCFKEHESWS